MKMTKDWIYTIYNCMVTLTTTHYGGRFGDMEAERVKKGLSVERWAWDILHYLGGREGTLVSALYADGLNDAHITTGAVYCYKQLKGGVL